MSDLIDRQAAIDVIDAVFPVDPMKSEYAQGIACGAALAKTYVEQLPSAQQWIPCSERLPEEFKRVLCCTDKEEMFLACVYIFDNGYTFDNEERMMWDGDVVAWMPLPEPYKGGDE